MAHANVSTKTDTDIDFVAIVTSRAIDKKSSPMDVIECARQGLLVSSFYLFCEVSKISFEENVDIYKDEHVRYYEALNSVKLWAKDTFKLQLVERAQLNSYTFSHDDIIVVVGQDGLVANTLKYLSTQRVIALNPLPDIYDGKLLSFELSDFEHVITAEANNDELPDKCITMAEVTTNVGQTLLAVNDLFIGPRTHASLRYQLAFGNHREEQSSSGIIISTGLGASGWLSSVIAGAEGLTGQPIARTLMNDLTWDARKLCFSVREPFPSRTTSVDTVFGQISERKVLTIRSKTPENAVIFSDGIESDYIAFNAGTTATVKVAKQQGTLVVQ